MNVRNYADRTEPRLTVKLIRYLALLDNRRLLLWSAFIWYVVIMARHATASSAVWLNSAGIAAVISVILAANAIPPGRKWRDLGFWPLARFFLIPFCVSSFSAVMHKAGLVLIFPRDLTDNLVAGRTVALFLLLCAAARHWGRAADRE